jgi:hypothetical protein
LPPDQTGTVAKIPEAMAAPGFSMRRTVPLVSEILPAFAGQDVKALAQPRHLFLKRGDAGFEV